MNELRGQVDAIVSELLQGRTEVGSAEEAARLKLEIVDEAVGLGPLEDLLRFPDISEIMVNGPNRVYVERNGRIERSEKRFTNERHLRAMIERIIAPLGRRIDESQPMVDARLPDGSRVNAIIEPLSLDGATLTIRRFGAHRMQASDLIRIGAAAPEILDFLRASVEARLNILVSGGTGSGKTTFLNVLSGYIANTDRIITIEDAAELSLNQDHVVRLEARPPNIQGAGEIRIRDLVRNSLRMRPDRIIVGECRGGEALDMLQAMNTGHDGSLTTRSREQLRATHSHVIETMVMMAGFDLPMQGDPRTDGQRRRYGACISARHARRLAKTRAAFPKSSVSRAISSRCKRSRVTISAASTKTTRSAGSFVFTGVQPICLDKFAEYGITYDVRSSLTRCRSPFHHGSHRSRRSPSSSDAMADAPACSSITLLGSPHDPHRCRPHLEDSSTRFDTRYRAGEHEGRTANAIVAWSSS